MTAPPVSIVVVSRGRPNLLARCLLGVAQLQYSPFEVVVVADPAGVRSASGLPFSDAIKIVSFDQANISAARNIGISHAAGEFVAFIDDDAVPEPSWLQDLMEPSQSSEVTAMGGFVRGRNGISWQWRARGLDPMGQPYPLKVDGPLHKTIVLPDGHAVKTEGTNMAVRRDVLLALGGFDPAFHYFLDETDLNMRHASAGHKTALVPKAEVHHGFAENEMRREDRVPRDLFSIGASWAVFQRKHVPEDQRGAHWEALRAGERDRLLRHMVTGALDPVMVRRLIKRLDAGFSAGSRRPLGPHTVVVQQDAAFLAFPSMKRPSKIIATQPQKLRQTLDEAALLVSEGQIVSVLSMSRTAAFHTVRFTNMGVWLQRGGIYGKSERHEPLFTAYSESERVEKERKRVAHQRTINEN